MTNEDDYRIAHTTTPCTTPTESMLNPGILGDIGDDAIEVAHKIDHWKTTPRVNNRRTKFAQSMRVEQFVVPAF